MGPFTGRPRETLATHANGITALLFECLNETSGVMRRAKTQKDDHLLLKAAAATMTSGKDLLEFGVGKMTKLNVNVRNQEDLPLYDEWVRQLPPHQQKAFDELLDEWMARRAIPASATVVEDGERRDG